MHNYRLSIFVNNGKFTHLTRLGWITQISRKFDKKYENHLRTNNIFQNHVGFLIKYQRLT
jgi:hypothetical protein